ncbi:hypothetical protein SCD_n02767 [Sulfuricella denitrificans skB26]|uniref:Transmembrane protein n=1 Tax=Sulfuricella denitrificans (strain DSM 22764 / NBRC 105220 / skB26) TaxID=1163617 RepID=S6B815_SULDS|nr:hypothetical protein [Sulfuricella denitrificans]BAN36567.1 hypothetical protein SCD_n02767 [Sulfuricella denitrificans skB26]
MTRRILRWLGIATLVIGYPLLAHYTNESAQNSNLGALVAIAPVVLIALVLAWNSPRRVIMLGALMLSCVALWAGWSALEQHFGLVYWLQNVGMQLILFMTFGRTLIAGRQPLCTRFAEAVHAPLTPQHELYARQVTVAWTLFFAVMALVSTGLFFLAPLVIWSFFANFLTLPLVALMFIAEYWIRRWVLPEMRQTRILDAVRAYRNTSARPR